MLSGLDRVARDGLPLPGRGRVAVLCNATTVSASWVPTVELLQSLPGVQVVRILSPQHGFVSDKQDNMCESDDCLHPRCGIPIVSLYGERREPGGAALADIDALIVDLQDVGTRVYTFLTTAVLSLRAAAARGLPTIVLDRPNPIGGAVEGPVLEKEFESFVGACAVPLRHGLTAGEFCRFAAATGAAASGTEAVQVVPLEGWHRAQYHDQTGQPWTMPSPNMPALETAIVYPGMVALEGTVLSEGRGTTRPFELWGAPWIEPERVLAVLAEAGYLRTPASSAQPTGSIAAGEVGSPLAGALLREVAFEPTFQKFAGELVRGFQMHVLARDAFRPVAAALTLLWAVRRAHPDEFAWREPPYEYEWKRLPIDLIFGTAEIRRAIERGDDPAAIVARWAPPIDLFLERAREHLLYGPLLPRAAESGES